MWNRPSSPCISSPSNLARKDQIRHECRSNGCDQSPGRPFTTALIYTRAIPSTAMRPVVLMLTMLVAYYFSSRRKWDGKDHTWQLFHPIGSCWTRMACRDFGLGPAVRKNLGTDGCQPEDSMKYGWRQNQPLLVWASTATGCCWYSQSPGQRSTIWLGPMCSPDHLRNGHQRNLLFQPGVPSDPLLPIRR